MRHLLALFPLVIIGCAGAPKRQLLPENPCVAIESFVQNELAAYQNRLDEASFRFQDEQWKVETAASDASQEKLAAQYINLQKVTYDAQVLQHATQLKVATRDLTAEACAFTPVFNRAFELLERTILSDEKVIAQEAENQKRQDSFSERSNAFRMAVEGESEPLSRALLGKKIGSEPDRKNREKWTVKYAGARAKAWENWGFRELIKARNQEARLAGFANYYEYRFFRNQLDLPSYRQLVAEVKQKVAPKVRKALTAMGNRAGVKKVQIWDMRYLREKSSDGEVNDWLTKLPEQDVMAVADEFYQSLGIRIHEYGFVQDLYPRPGKNTHAFAMGLVFPRVSAKGELLAQPKSDIRFVANLKQPVRWGDISTVIHELGHAVHMGEVRQPIAYFRGIGSVETEAFAMLLERMADAPEFVAPVLARRLSKKSAELLPALRRRDRAAKIEMVFGLLRQIFFSDFEYELYRNPDAAFPELWNRLHQEYWGVEVPVAHSDWDVEHFVMAPVYVQNYAIGLLMVAQYLEAIRKDFGRTFGSAELGTRLRQMLFAPGLRFDYRALTEQFTTKPLSATYIQHILR